MEERTKLFPVLLPPRLFLLSWHGPYWRHSCPFSSTTFTTAPLPQALNPCLQSHDLSSQQLSHSATQFSVHLSSCSLSSLPYLFSSFRFQPQVHHCSFSLLFLLDSAVSSESWLVALTPYSHTTQSTWTTSGLWGPLTSTRILLYVCETELLQLLISHDTGDIQHQGQIP